MIRLLFALFLLAPAAWAHQDSWVLVRDGNTSSMHGDMRDLQVARRHLRELGPGYLWFRHQGKAYVVKDGKIAEQIEAAVKPQEELGEEQARLGRRQAELGREQARLGRKQAALGQKQARAGLREARREMKGERAGRDEREADQENEETQGELSRAMETLGHEQEKLGHEQEKMGEQQQALSREVERKVQELIVASLRDGTAQSVND